MTSLTPSLTPLLKLHAVGRQFGSNTGSAPSRAVLNDLNLSVQPSEFVAIIGESGGGKSTLLNLIAGLDRPDSGEIRFQDRSYGAMSDDELTALRRTGIGFVFQAFHLLAHLNAWQNVALPLLLAGTDPYSAKERAYQLLNELRLGERADGFPPQLSGGEQQRVALARALANRPALLLADEPTGNLDPSSAAPALLGLREACSASGSAVIMVTHSIQAAQCADRILRLSEGQLHPFVAGDVRRSNNEGSSEGDTP